MDFEFSSKVKDLVKRVIAFRDTHIYPNERLFTEQTAYGANRWRPAPILEELRKLAKNDGLWNLFLGDERYGPGLSNFDYAPLAEIMGCNEWAPEIFNCNPPDTGNMGILAAYGTEEQKQEWLRPLLSGEIRSCFAMTEPAVASSDATNVSTSAGLRGDEWIINGEKWFISGPGNPLCKIAIVMCRSNPGADPHSQHSMILVPLESTGVVIKRQLTVMGFDFAPRGHSALSFDQVRVPAKNVLLGAGRGFEIAQGRLGPGRVHHAMRCVGAAERALELLCRRGLSRTAFGTRLTKLGGNADLIAESRIEINMVRECVLKTAHLLDTVGPVAARSEISQIKVSAPRMACRVVDRAIQIHGAAGLSQDTPLAALYARLRALRIVDGPDEVHLRVIAKAELAKYAGE
ncbi:MAG TPA: acyl-CoA dehydrogenase family protein [Terriglobales bacterium]|jgi:acyl-CoA dehydrogenase|nr:acyl-CoA dehydrogenase family protein [Terriglobales bacterium]